MIQLRVKAPFAAFRDFSAGSYRSSAPFVTPSSAYGLVLNVAGIESRYDDGESAMTLTAEGLPPVEIALGALTLPSVQSIYQQLHNYPVGETGRERASETFGNKYNIQPIRREFLAALDAYVCLRGNDSLEELVRQSLSTSSPVAGGMRRYGLPFAGDNNFLLSDLYEERVPAPAFWFSKLSRDEVANAPNVCRLTVTIDRKNMSRTVAALFSRAPEPSLGAPDGAWTELPAAT